MKMSTPEKKAIDRAYYLANRERIKASVKAWQCANHEKALGYKRKWKSDNPRCWRNDKNSIPRAKRWISNNRDKHYESVKLWRENNPEKQVSYVNKRRALKLGVIGAHFTGQQWKDLKTKYGNRCLCCGDKKKLVADHVIPLSKGGTDSISNIQPLCHFCNSKKWVRSDDYRETSCAA